MDCVAERNIAAIMNVTEENFARFMGTLGKVRDGGRILLPASVADGGVRSAKQAAIPDPT